jgi:lipoate-protein ligase A
VHQAGISDLARDDRKVGGACIYRSRGLLYYSATVLVDPDITRITRYLAHPPREPDYRRGRAHADFVLGLAAHGEVHSAAELEARLHRQLRVDNLEL